MNAWKNHRLSFILASSSLVLLLLFQIFWLRNIYQNEKENIRERAELAFEEAQLNVKDSIINIFLFEKIGLKDKLNNLTELNNSMLQTNINREVKVLEGDTIVEVHMDMQSYEGEKKSSFEFSMEMDSLQEIKITKSTSGGFPNKVSKFNFFPNDPILLKNSLTTSIAKIDLPTPFEIITLKNDEVPKGDLYSNPQKDLFSENSYSIFFPNYRNFIFGKMLPQILFSVFLFGVIGFSFFMVWQSLAKQRRLTELKNDFISNVTHELKTPITTVGVALEALSNFNALQNPERTKEYLNISKHELQRLSLLVDKVLKMSLFEKKEPELKLEIFDMQELIKGVLRSMKLQFENLSADVNFEFQGSGFSIKGDKIHLTNVVYNLLDNALKYSKENPVITLLLKKENNQLQLQVKDRGIGISPDLKDKVFEKFFRVPHGDKHDVKGYGLGLSYVASVIKKHKGNIKVDSQLQEGTQFTISLPTSYE